MYNWIIYDVLVVVVIFIAVSRSARQGFAVTLLRFIGYFLSWGAAIALSPIAAKYAFENFFRQRIIDSLAKNLTESAASNTAAMSEQLTKALSTLPKFIAATVNIDSSTISSVLQKSVEGNSQSAALYMTNTLIAPASTLFLRGLFFFLIFTIISIAIGWLCGVLKIVNKIPVVGSVNSFFGGLVGLLEGILILTVIAVAISMIIKLIPGPKTVLNDEVIKNTILFKHIYNFDPLQAKQLALTIAQNNPLK